jgi:hypothetical protein
VVVDPEEAERLVAEGLPVVLVGKDPYVLGKAAASAPDGVGRERWLAVMVGDPEDPTVMAAAREMAGELWPWASPEAAAGGSERGEINA